MAKVDLKAKAKECLEFNKKENVVAVIEDGTCFLRNAENHAKNYAHSKGLKVEVFTREDLFGEDNQSSKEGTSEKEKSKKVETSKEVANHKKSTK